MAFALASLVPLGVVVVGLVWIGAQVQASQSVERTTVVANEVTARIEGRVELYRRLVTTVSAGFGAGLAPEPESALRVLLASDRNIVDAAVVDAAGREVLRLERAGVVGSEQRRDRADDPAVSAVLHGADSFVGLARPTDGAQAGALVVAAPVDDPRRGEAVGAVVVTVAASVLVDGVRAIPLGDGQVEPYLATSDGVVLAHERLAVVLGAEPVPDAAREGLRRGLGDRWVVRGVTPLALDDDTYLVVAEQPALSALAPSVQSVALAALTSLVALLLAIVLRRRLARSVVRPTEELAAMADRLRAGDLTARGPSASIAELAALAESVDAMAVELERTVGRLRRSNRDLELFASAAAHDLRSPLHTIAAYVDLLRRRYAEVPPSGDPDVERHWGYVVEATRTLDALLGGLLAYSMLDQEGAAPDVEVDLDEVLDEVLVALAADLRATGATVERRPLPTVAGDRVQLHQLLQNLVHNALVHREPWSPPPTVAIDAEPAWSGSRPAWAVSVVDDGPGIDPRHHAEVLELFGRAPGAHAGAGIGLALCSRIVERHGGRIDVRSAPGSGSTFVVTLPAAVTGTTAGPEPGGDPPERAVPHGGGRGTDDR
ncbi:MAG TPA: ATP-binding protein [Acidimicrobiales bacterium]|nr:ATP-binding protein [Acidimicrobiales bacterium]